MEVSWLILGAIITIWLLIVIPLMRRKRARHYVSPTAEQVYRAIHHENDD